MLESEARAISGETLSPPAFSDLGHGDPADPA
jgi:hypothetical protein